MNTHSQAVESHLRRGRLNILANILGNEASVQKRPWVHKTHQ